MYFFCRINTILMQRYKTFMCIRHKTVERLGEPVLSCQYELSRMFSVFSVVKFLSCMDNATSYQTACCGVIYNVAILH